MGLIRILFFAIFTYSVLGGLIQIILYNLDHTKLGGYQLSILYVHLPLFLINTINLLAFTLLNTSKKKYIFTSTHFFHFLVIVGSWQYYEYEWDVLELKVDFPNNNPCKEIKIKSRSNQTTYHKINEREVTKNIKFKGAKAQKYGIYLTFMFEGYSKEIKVIDGYSPIYDRTIHIIIGDSNISLKKDYEEWIKIPLR